MKGVHAAIVVIISLIMLGCGHQMVKAEDKMHEVENQLFYIEPQLKFNYSMALNECKRLNMLMVTLDTKEKISRLHKLLKEVFLDKNQPIPKLYIGANDIAEFRKHIWVVTGDPVTIANWEPNEPNNYQDLNERCVNLGFHGNDQWNDINCSRQFGFICEQSKTDLEFANMANAMSKA